MFQFWNTLIFPKWLCFAENCIWECKAGFLLMARWFSIFQRKIDRFRQIKCFFCHKDFIIFSHSQHIKAENHCGEQWFLYQDWVFFRRNNTANNQKDSGMKTWPVYGKIYAPQARCEIAPRGRKQEEQARHICTTNLRFEFRYAPLVRGKFSP